MNIVENKSLEHLNLRDNSLGSTEYRGVSFKHSDARRLKFENATLLSSDLSHCKLIGATFRLSCKQGSNNKLDDLNVGLFLYWFMTMFNLSPNVEATIKSAIGSNLNKVKQVFDCEVSPEL